VLSSDMVGAAANEQAERKIKGVALYTWVIPECDVQYCVSIDMHATGHVK
jgi:hypothetical protein